MARPIRDEIREAAPEVFLGIVYWNRRRVLRFVRSSQAQVRVRLDRRRGWYRLPKPLGLATLVGTAALCAGATLSTPPTSRRKTRTYRSPTHHRCLRNGRRTAAGTTSTEPARGMANTRFAPYLAVTCRSTTPTRSRRIVALNLTSREVSRRLMTRDRLIPTSAGIALISVWLQFMIRDWFSHAALE